MSLPYSSVRASSGESAACARAGAVTAASSVIRIAAAQARFPTRMVRNAGAKSRRRAWLRCRLLLLEDIEHGCRRRVLELGRVLPHVERLARSHQNGDVLLAVDGVGDGRRIDAGAHVEAPQLLQALGVIGRERADVVVEGHQIASGRKRDGIVWVLQ